MAVSMSGCECQDMGWLYLAQDGIMSIWAGCI
jgi:hypothetical protein